MTTTVIVRTHDWPVSVSSDGHHSHSDGKSRSWGQRNDTVFQPAHSEASYNVTNTTTVTVRELDKDATGLEDASKPIEI